jgi:serine/threonine protein phosphatase PrpC
MMTSNPEAFEIEMAALSDAGTERGHNEDHCGKYIKSKTCGLVAVADGMATLEGGELASQRAILALMRSFRELAPGMTQTQRLVRAARSANYEVYDMAVVVPQLRGMSTTLTAVSISDGEMTAAHVGNSRVYLLRDGYINQLSKDHTVAAEAAEQTGHALRKGSDCAHAKPWPRVDRLCRPVRDRSSARGCGDPLHRWTDARLRGFGDRGVGQGARRRHRLPQTHRRGQRPASSSCARPKRGGGKACGGPSKAR